MVPERSGSRRLRRPHCCCAGGCTTCCAGSPCCTSGNPGPPAHLCPTPTRHPGLPPASRAVRVTGAGHPRVPLQPGTRAGLRAGRAQQGRGVPAQLPPGSFPVDHDLSASGPAPSRTPSAAHSAHWRPPRLHPAGRSSCIRSLGRQRPSRHSCAPEALGESGCVCAGRATARRAARRVCAAVQLSGAAPPRSAWGSAAVALARRRLPASAAVRNLLRAPSSRCPPAAS